MISINRLFQSIAIVSILLTYGVFGWYYLEQRDQTARLILESIKDNVSEVSYVVSRNLNAQQPVDASRAILDRAVSNSGFIEAIALFDGATSLLTTDPFHSFAPSQLFSFSNEVDEGFVLLEDEGHARGLVRYYMGAQLKQLTLVFFIDHAEIQNYLDITQGGSIWVLGAFPAMLIAALALFVRAWLVIPLQSLRQFAYYHDKVPDRFRVRELESIRYTLNDTFKRLEHEQRTLYDRARLDSLSGLANRHSLQEYVNSLISESSRRSQEFAFLFMDFDNFKAINDSMGHEIGDEVIHEASLLIGTEVRMYDFVARVGGDEFVIVIKSYQSKEELCQIVQRIQSVLSDTPFAGAHKLHIGSSVGIAIYPEDGTDFLSLMKNSDIAMFEAKSQRNSSYHFFSHALNERVQKNISLDKAMRRALLHEEFELYYQPKISLLDGSIEGAEALLRWRRSDGVIIAPGEFIPLAEENGFIVELGDWVINEAVRQLAEWRLRGINLKLSINIATKQLLETEFESKLLAALDEQGISPTQLDLEITEYLFIAQTKHNSRLIERLQQHGFTLSLDDFGTGYSSLSYLKRFNVDQIKIDKVFIDDFQSHSGAIFIDTIVKLGQALHIKIIAEGVETQAQADYLRSVGCHAVQGYLFSKPLPLQSFEDYLVKNHKATLI